MRVEYPNYMLFDDARPGTHQLRFTLEAYEGLRFERVTISPSSGIALTKTSPFPARLTVSERGLEAGRPTVGKAVTIVVRVENRGRGPARDVPLAMSTDPGLRFVEHGYDHPIRLIPVGHAVERRVRLVPRTAGRHVIRLSAGAGRATSSGELSFAAVRPTGHSGRLWLWLVGGCAAVGACTLAIRRRILGDQS
jgi:hypothetical protein